jgi:hypothetical protein
MTKNRLSAFLFLASFMAAPIQAGVTIGTRTPYHSAIDAVARPNESVTLEAWFSHSAGVQKAVENQKVHIETLRDGAWESLGETQTDGDGHARFAMKAPANPGVFSFRWRWKDQFAEARLFVLAANQTATVFDIDGTLNQADKDNFKDYLRRLRRASDPEKVPPRAGAVNAAHRAMQNGLVIYLTGRPPFLGRPTREWLAHFGFPQGVVLWMPRVRDILPTQGGVGQGKLESLRRLQAQGLQILQAYGNATTDIFAYEQAGIPKTKTFILGKHGGEAGTVALGESFPADK